MLGKVWILFEKFPILDFVFVVVVVVVVVGVVVVANVVVVVTSPEIRSFRNGQI